MTRVRLRPVEDADLPTIFEQQRDPASTAMAGVPARDRAAFDAHWAKIRADPACWLRVIDVDGERAGFAVSFPRNGVREVGYWIDRAWWGRGVASVALGLMLAEIRERPLHAIVLETNEASMRVLQKNGFTANGRDGDVLKFVSP